MLITLSIIGVVAALTIPSLVRKYERQQWIAGYKSAYNIVSQATKMIIAKNNGASFVRVWQSDEDVYNAYLPFLKVNKKCENQNIYGSCFASNYIPSNYYYFTPPTYSVVLSNGTALGFNNFCPAPGANCAVEAHVIIFIDINGKKGPNVMGKDFHVVAYDDPYNGTSIEPMGLMTIDFDRLMETGEVVDIYTPEEDIKTSCPDDLSKIEDGSLCGIRILRGDYGLKY